jgi:hypothetical protein
VKSWRDTGDTLAGIITEKRQNFDPYTPPASTENLHFMFNGETRRAPRLPVIRPQTAWEDTYRVSFMVHGTPTEKPGPEQHSPLDRLTSTRGKKKKLSNKQ